MSPLKFDLQVFFRLSKIISIDNSEIEYSELATSNEKPFSLVSCPRFGTPVLTCWDQLPGHF